MALAQARWYTTGLDKLTSVGSGFIWSSGDARILLLTSAYTFDQAHNDIADLTGELSGSGYARRVLTNKVRVKNNTDHRIDYTADTVVFPTLGLGAGTPAFAVIFDQAGGSDALRELLCCITLTATPPNGSDYTVGWPGSGSNLLGFIGPTLTYTP